MIISTFPTYEEAKKISNIFLNERLLACANLVPEITSFYWWNENIQEDNEILAIFKTRKELESLVIQRIEQLHSYMVPAIYAVDSTSSISKTYLQWIINETKDNIHSKKKFSSKFFMKLIINSSFMKCL